MSPRTNNYQGPTSIVNLVADLMEEINVPSTSLMVHVPYYVQLDEDHLAMARIMEVFCAMYGFPDSLADTARGERQYQEISRAVEANPQVKHRVGELETEYDQVQPINQGPEERITLSADMEEFLQEMGKRLDNDSKNE